MATRDTIIEVLAALYEVPIMFRVVRSEYDRPVLVVRGDAATRSLVGTLVVPADPMQHLKMSYENIESECRHLVGMCLWNSVRGQSGCKDFSRLSDPP